MEEDETHTWHWKSARHRQRTTLSGKDELREEDVLLFGQGAGGILLSSACSAGARGTRGVERCGCGRERESRLSAHLHASQAMFCFLGGGSVLASSWIWF